MRTDNQIRQAKKKYWAAMRRAAHNRAKAKNRRKQDRARIKILLKKAAASGKPIPINKTFWQRKRDQLQEKIDRGIAQLERGEGISGPAARAELLRHRAARKKVPS